MSTSSYFSVAVWEMKTNICLHLQSSVTCDTEQKGTPVDKETSWHLYEDLLNYSSSYGAHF